MAEVTKALFKNAFLLGKIASSSSDNSFCIKHDVETSEGLFVVFTHHNSTAQRISWSIPLQSPPMLVTAPNLNIFVFKAEVAPSSISCKNLPAQTCHGSPSQLNFGKAPLLRRQRWQRSFLPDDAVKVALSLLKYPHLTAKSGNVGNGGGRARCAVKWASHF